MGVLWDLFVMGNTLSVISFIAVIGGLGVSAWLTHVFIPALYMIVENWRIRRRVRGF